MGGIVIVGAGQAAASMAAKLRALKYDGAITVIGAEPIQPYQRPPLSKAYLLGEMELERLTLRAPDWWQENDITLRLGTSVTAIDTEAQTVTLSDGETLDYVELALCTGATPRRLPAAIGGDLGNVFTVRNLADVDRMQPHFTPGKRLVVVGGGYIGLEAAAVARKLGLEVTLVEAAPRILGRVACKETADAIRTLHRERGVEILEGVGLTRLTGEETVTGAILEDGHELPADFAIVGIGITPDEEVAREAGIHCENGIAADAQGRTSAPHIWAAGDCASFPGAEGRIRLESVGNAIDMGELVAANMLGAERAYTPKPWFWSDQFDAKLQIAGLNAGYDQVVSRRDDGSSFWYFRAGRLIAVDAINDARAYMVGKRLIEAGKPVTPETVETTAELKALMK
ncbi:3-phenylpropionate/trans-cinnamate dioxygenase ferredoxin reductase subunit [Thioclava sp. ES.031]|uniref:NAD(P)/FAD-dependent oxidoreductase n=1 Tax=Thioclava sp. ES.031 TaxID=1798203 RepID=UPI000BF72A7A|nr:FAD-dependent oxidoreductase [Thioclava sp. ES.031]PFG61691.1 3-phenylpropionate/trans-cinnamate dioxygenase ferredoxin reductase subunit [Thioclava sp. ES.031]